MTAAYQRIRPIKAPSCIDIVIMVINISDKCKKGEKSSLFCQNSIPAELEVRIGDLAHDDRFRNTDLC